MPHVTKLPPPPSASNGGENQTSSNNEVQQKLYNLSAEECDKVIRSFKDYTKVNTMYGKIESSTIPADSSIWLIEAALNFDFDRKPNSSITAYDSCEFEIDLINNIHVNANEFLSAYQFAYNYVIQSVASTKQVKLIDVRAITYNSKIKYLFDIIYFLDESTQKIQSPCDPFTSPQSGAWSLGYWISGQCFSPPANDASVMVTTKLNCTSYNPGCSGSWYWMNITNTTLNNVTGTYSPNLFYVASTVTPCNIFAWTQMNTYVSNCQSYGASYHPGGSYILIDYQIQPGLISLGGISWKIFWNLKIRYGIPQCNQGGGNG